MSPLYNGTEFYRGTADSWFEYAALAFFIGIAFSLMGWANARTAEKKSLSMNLFWVNAISFCSYLMIILRLTPTIEGPNLANPVEPARYLEWITTCPLLIHLIGNATRTQLPVKQIMIADYALTTFGIGGALLPRPFDHYSNTCAACCYVIVAGSLYRFFTDAINGDTKCSIEAHYLRTCRATTLICWSLFPFFYYGYIGEKFSFEVFEAGLCCADVGAKVFLTLVMTNASVEQSQNEKVDEMTLLAEDIEKELDNVDDILGKMMPAKYVVIYVQSAGSQGSNTIPSTAFSRT